jgi:hypothetical protein
LPSIRRRGLGQVLHTLPHLLFQFIEGSVDAIALQIGCRTRNVSPRFPAQEIEPRITGWRQLCRPYRKGTFMVTNLFRVQRISEGKWLAELSGWTGWQDSAKTFSSKYDAEREGRNKAPGNYRVIEYVANPLRR